MFVFSFSTIAFVFVVCGLVATIVYCQLNYLFLRRSFDGSGLLRLVGNELDNGRKTPSDDDAADDDNESFSNDSKLVSSTPPLQQQLLQSQPQPQSEQPQRFYAAPNVSTFSWFEELFFGVSNVGNSSGDSFAGYGSGFGGASWLPRTPPTMPASRDEFYNYFVGGEQNAQEQRRQNLLPIVFSHQAELAVFPLNLLWSLPSPRCANVVKQLIETYRLVDDERLFYCVDVPLPTFAVDGIVSNERRERLASASYVARIFHCWPLTFVPSFVLDSMLLKPQLVCAAAMTYATSLALNGGWAICLSSTPGCGAAIGDLESPMTWRNILHWNRLRNRAIVGNIRSYNIVLFNTLTVIRRRSTFLCLSIGLFGMETCTAICIYKKMICFLFVFNDSIFI